MAIAAPHPWARIRRGWLIVPGALLIAVLAWPASRAPRPPIERVATGCRYDPPSMHMPRAVRAHHGALLTRIVVLQRFWPHPVLRLGVGPVMARLWLERFTLERVYMNRSFPSRIAHDW